MTQTAELGSPFLQTDVTSAVTVNNLIIDAFYDNYAQTYNLTTASNISVCKVQLKNTYLVSNATMSDWSNSPSTPSIPLSEAATSYIYSYTILVYLYGGVVTQVVITNNNGTPCTVLSSSSGISMSGEPFRLSPFDSIAITYTSAPN
ncbi:MAG: hypothetical protein QXO75_04960 [Nitrososphaerota archaeon]